jgi:hypothetical protein
LPEPIAIQARGSRAAISRRNAPNEPDPGALVRYLSTRPRGRMAELARPSPDLGTCRPAWHRPDINRRIRGFVGPRCGNHRRASRGWKITWHLPDRQGDEQQVWPNAASLWSFNPALPHMIGL